MVSNAQTRMSEKAQDNADIMDGWLNKQADIVHTLATGLSRMDQNDKEEIMNYLEANLSENEDALMYYCCFGYDKGIFTAQQGVSS